jgi:hypothetical protein
LKGVEQVTVTGGRGVIDIRREIDRPELDPALRIALATGQLRRPLADTLRPALDLLVDGPYEVAGPERLAADVEAEPLSPWPPADAVRVEYYRTAIRAGHKPVALLADTRILDGHHKIAAYQAENVAPVVVRITTGV